jgi:hypothetical protein
MNPKTKKIVIISSIVGVIGAIVAFMIYNGRKTNTSTGVATNPVTNQPTTINQNSSSNIGTAVSPTTGTPVTTATAAASTPLAPANPWIRFNWTGGNRALKYNGSTYSDMGYSATGFQLTNVAELPSKLGPGTKVEIKMEPASLQDLNGIRTVLYLGDDTQPGNFMSGAGGLITVDLPIPLNPNKIPTSGYFRMI